ncbi:MAG: MarR family winged helix-turn-helix transcriptional regulator [Dongiaceae bacterium]
MSGHDPERSLGFLLHDVSRLLRKRFDRRARAIGLTRAQWSVLAHLSRNEGINQSALAEILEIEPITLVYQLDRLEAAGWVERRLDPGDRRVRLLHLTDGGRAILAKMQGMGLETRAEALAGLSAHEHDALLDTLLRIKANLSAREVASQAGEADKAEAATRLRRPRRAAR